MGAPGGMPGFGAGMGGMGGMPPGGMNNPMAQAAARNLMSNPQAMQQMLQVSPIDCKFLFSPIKVLTILALPLFAKKNPMVQQMIQNDPNIPPHVRQTFQALSSNPAMMNQLSQMMNDPTMRAQMEAAMQAGGGGLGGLGGMGGFGAGMGGAGGMPPMNNNSTSGTGNTTGNNNSGGGNDQAQTEEEMIAEAIRRSLQDS